jgi:hypothetical protein
LYLIGYGVKRSLLLYRASPAASAILVLQDPAAVCRYVPLHKALSGFEQTGLGML